jgi:hypothetical protein
MTSKKELSLPLFHVGRFKVGYDPARHIFTREEQIRGGRTTWARYMRQWRREMGLPIPAHLVEELDHVEDLPAGADKGYSGAADQTSLLGKEVSYG